MIGEKYMSNPFYKYSGLSIMMSGRFSSIATGQMQSAAIYQDDVYRLLLITRSATVNLSFDQMHAALSQTGFDPRDVYNDLATGEETERIILLTEALGFPQHALIGRGVKVTGKIIEADREPVRWLPEG